MRYEEAVRRICGENWRTVNIDEKDGGYGVALAIAFIKGTKPTVGDMCNHLGITPEEMLPAFNRLHRMGVFSRFNLRKDKTYQLSLSEDEAQRAFAHIAGLAGGLIGV